MMETKARNIIPSGIEPVDKLLGGLESGQSYLVHGEAAGKSLFGIKFLIEGLKRGENGALVIRYSPEDAVRRFARLGYDCLEDIYSGRLVILEYSNEIIEQISRLRQLTPVLRELEWLLSEARPKRLIFDPVTHLVLGKEEDLEARVREFAGWARSFGATVLFVANGYSEEVVHEFRSLVEESFRFEVKEIDERATRFIAFEKSPSIPDQAIEVDPSRGVFLLGRVQTQDSLSPAYERRSSQPLQPAALNIEPSDLTTRELPSLKTLAEIDEHKTDAPTHYDFAEGEEPLGDFGLPGALDTEALEPATAAEPATTVEPAAPDDLLELYQDVEAADISASSTEESGEYSAVEAEPQDYSAPVDDASSWSRTTGENQSDLLTGLLDELTSTKTPLDLDEFADVSETTDSSPPPEAVVEAAGDQQFQVGEDEDTASTSQLDREATVDSSAAREDASQASDQPVEPEQPAASEAASEADTTPRQGKYSRASDLKIESAVTARAVEVLLRPPEPDILPPSASAFPGLLSSPLESPASPAVRAKDFNVLVIDDDLASCEIIAQTLGEYTIETVHDGVAGLAKLISFKPDLIILDVDLPIIDGFKVLAHIRSSLNMPIIIISGTHLRASDRLLSAELGADYYMTKPFSGKELRHKARQLIARYRGINSWIVTSSVETETEDDSSYATESAASSGSADDAFTRYQDFAAKVEKSVKSAIDDGTSFSIVGVRLSQMTANGGHLALQLYELVSSLVRDSDLISTNPRNDLVILLADADTTGARAFLSRLRQRVLDEMGHEPIVWIRSFPDLEEANGPVRQNQNSINSNSLNRRTGDNQDQENSPTQSSSSPSEENEQPSRATDGSAEENRRPDPRGSHIDFLEYL